MFISAGEPGNAKKIQASVAAARKVFRILGVRYPRSVLDLNKPGCSTALDAVNAFLRVTNFPGRESDTYAFLQPLESVSPIILNPHLNPKKPVPIELLNKVNKCNPFVLLYQSRSVW